MTTPIDQNRVGVLLSGGLDSCILLGHLLDQGHRVRPIYVRCGLYWQPEEILACELWLKAMNSPHLEELVSLAMPLGDLYESHWSISGTDVPRRGSADEEVFLPGRNVLLIVKAALWCQMHGIGRLALAPLQANPFDDARPEFFDAFETALNLSAPGDVRIERPFGRTDKASVMRLGRRRPLELTFSCIRPVDGLHCGRCNKCGERAAAFEAAMMPDPTRYAATSFIR